MRIRCKKAYLAITDRRESARDLAEAEEKQFEARREKSEKEEKERLAKFREELKKKPSFYSEKVMNTRIYGKETTKSEDPKSSSKQVNKEKSSSSRKEMSLSSGKRVFDGGQGSSSSGTNDKKWRMGAN